MDAAYLQKVNSLVQAGRESLAHELSVTFVEEVSGAGSQPQHGRRPAGRRTPTRGDNGRPRGQAGNRLGRIGRFTRSSLDRFDRYTLDVFNPGMPYRPRLDRG